MHRLPRLRLLVATALFLATPAVAQVTQVPLEEVPALAADVIERLDADPSSDLYREQFLGVFLATYGPGGVHDTRMLGVTSEEITVFGEVMLRARAMALEGDARFLDALIRATEGGYYRGGEGGEWLNEILWEVLTAQPQATVNALARLPDDERQRLVEEVYLRPIHDGFDFARIHDGLGETKAPDHVRDDVRRILDIVGPLITY